MHYSYSKKIEKITDYIATLRNLPLGHYKEIHLDENAKTQVKTEINKLEKKLLKLQSELTNKFK